MVPPKRDFVLIGVLVAGFAVSYLLGTDLVLYPAAALAALPPVWGAIRDLGKKKITIDVFNTFALGVAPAPRRAGWLPAWEWLRK